MVRLRRIGGVGRLHQRSPRLRIFRPQLVEERLPRAFVQESAIQRSIGRIRSELAVERHQSIQRFSRLAAFGGRQCIDRLVQRLGHARRLEHCPELDGERRDLVVLHRDGTAGVMLAPPRQFRQALIALGAIPGAGKLHPVTARYTAMVGGAEPALDRILVVGMQHRISEAVPFITIVPTRRRHQPQSLATIWEASGDLPADSLLVSKHQIQRRRTNFAGRLEGLIHRLRAGQIEEGIQGAIGLQLRGFQRKAVTTAEL